MDEVGGAGGKQLRPRRRVVFSRTPYDRPLVGRHAPPELRNPNSNGGSSWFSKLLSPITNGAGRLLSSVFRRQESAETSSSYSSSTDDGDEDSSEEEEQEDNVQVVAAVENRIVTEARKQSGEPTSVGNKKSQSKLFEIEQVLAGKTFTSDEVVEVGIYDGGQTLNWIGRDEFIHLTGLLQSRVVDSSGSRVHEGTTSTDLLSDTHLRHAALEETRRWSEERRKEKEGSGNGGCDSGLCGNVSRLALSPDVLHETSSSPADIAKAYMGTQHTWSSSPVSFQSHLSRDEVIQNRCWSDTYRSPTPAMMSNRMQSLACTPYAMADHLQTPYSRAAYSQNYFQMLKRRSSLIDDSWASAETIRRIRQKSFGNVSSFSTPFTGFNSSMIEAGPSIACLSSGLEAGQNTFDKKPIDTDRSNNVLLSSQVREDAHQVCTVPSHSSLTAQKIQEHLDGKLPPNENSSEEQLTFARDKSSSQPTMNLINCDSDVQNNYKDNGNTPLLTATSLERPSSSVKGSLDVQSIRPEANKADLADGSLFEKRKDQGLENDVHGSKNDTIPLDVQTSKSVSSASDVSLQCNATPTFKLGSENTSTGPVLSCTSAATKLDTSKPNFNFKFDSKPERLFSSVAFASNSQSTSVSNHLSTSQSISAGSIHGLGPNSVMASQPVSRFMFSTPLFAGTSVQSTGPSIFGSGASFGSSSIFGTPFTSGSGASFGSSSIFGTPFTSGSGASFGSSIFGKPFAFGSASKTSFGSTTRTAQSSSSTFSFGSGANLGLSAMTSTSGFASTPTSVFGSGTSSVHSNSTSFCLNSVTPLKSSSASFGTSSLFGISSNGASNQTSGIKEPVEGSAAKFITETISSVKCSLGDTSLPSTEFASSCGTQKTMSLSTNTTSASGTMPIVTPLVDATNHCQTTGKDIVEDAATSSGPVPSVFVQQPSLMASPTSVTLAVDSQSNTQSTEAQPGSPSQNLSVSGAQTAIASAGHIESTEGSFPGIRSEKNSRKVTRGKRDKTRRK